MIFKLIFKNPIHFVTTGLVTMILMVSQVIAADDGSILAGNPFSAKPAVGAAILPDIPQIAWADLTQGQLIGKGGFGDVYAGQWEGLNVAIKKLHMSALPNAAIQRDFTDEVRVMWSSQYPRCLRLYGVCNEPGNCAMVMELMQRSLNDLIHSPEEITEGKRLQIAIDIAQGLASLHDQKIIHRDLKSQNILLSKGDRGKLSDFGLAKIRVHTNSTTKMNHATGTVRWSAPEVFGLKPKTTFASDMYSYGMILWELLTRKIPFAEQPDDNEVRAAVKGGEREEIPEGFHPVWQQVIEGCWQQDPAKRPTAAAVLARFRLVLPPQRPQWLPEEAPQSPIRAEGYVRYPASESDWNLVLRCYAPNPVPGYDVGRVEVIFNPSQNAEFAGRRNRLQQRHGNPRYSSKWRQDRDGEARAEIARRLEVLTDPYDDENYPNVKLMPLWHGAQRNKLGSLLSAGYGAFGDTDDGYFGKGIYATFDAAYAQVYADKFGPVDLENGVLIFNWGITYGSRPILKSDYNENKKTLNWVPDHARYDSHFVPVVPHPLQKGDYVPITPPEAHQFTEVVFFDTSHLLPRYLVTLQPTFLWQHLGRSVLNSPTSQFFAMLEALKERRRGVVEADAKQVMDAEAQQLAVLKERVAAELAAAVHRAEDAQQVQQLAATNRELAATNDTLMQQLAAMSNELAATSRELITLKERAPAEKLAAVKLAAAAAVAELAEAVNRAKAAEQATAAAVRRAEEAQQAQQLAATNRERELVSTHDALVQQLVATNDAQAQQLAEAMRRAEAAEQSVTVLRAAAAKPTKLAIADRDDGGESKDLDVIGAPAIPIPPIAKGFEAIYQRFFNDVLIYRPQPGNDAGMIKLPIAALKNPLESTFDLSQCGNAGQYLSISTGYRKKVNPANANKVEIWFAPKFLIDAELSRWMMGSAKHFKSITGKWAANADVGIFWNWGGRDDMTLYDYLTTENMDNLSKISLYENWMKASWQDESKTNGWSVCGCEGQLKLLF